jgi:hypothetical protein
VAPVTWPEVLTTATGWMPRPRGVWSYCCQSGFAGQSACPAVGDRVSAGVLVPALAALGERNAARATAATRSGIHASVIR